MKILTPCYLLLITLSLCAKGPKIAPSETHLNYWTLNGELSVLLGGSKDDNLFQIDNLEAHLDEMVAVGANYVRCTMSSRDPGNVWAFAQREDGLYNLRELNPEYWRRFAIFLEETAKRDIIVQIEVWATFDFYRQEWDKNPYNPKNNIQYDSRRSKLPEVVDSHPTYTENPFFRSVPSQLAIPSVLEHQQRFVDAMLHYSLQYDHVLYCMDNETSVTSDWAKFWSNYIRKKASEIDKEVYITEMWDPWELSHPFHAETFDNPQYFDFVDISQNNHIVGERHWTNGLEQFERLRKMGKLRPITNIKVYGKDGGRHKKTHNAIESYVKNVLMGCGSTRFHRPPSGQGLNDTAKNVILSLRQALERVNLFDMAPANHLLMDRAENEAFCSAKAGEHYLIFFPAGGEVKIELPNEREIAWVRVESNRWIDSKVVKAGSATINTPDNESHWLAVIY